MSNGTEKNKYHVGQAVEIVSGHRSGRVGIIGMVELTRVTTISRSGREEEIEVSYEVLDNPFGDHYSHSEGGLAPLGLDEEIELTWQAREGDIVEKDGKRYLVDGGNVRSESTGCDPGLAHTYDKFYSVIARELDAEGNPSSEKSYFRQKEPLKVLNRS